MVADADSLDQPTLRLREEEATWRLFHHLFRPPSPEQWAWLSLETVQDACALLAERCGSEPAEVATPLDYDHYHEEFLATFDVGMPHPPCPLLESHWNRQESPGLVRQRNMQFFEQFGLDLRSADGSPPDHLRHQLELLQYLCQLEVARRTHGMDGEVAQIARAREEYLRLHLLSWVPAAAEELSRRLSHLWPAG